MDLYKAFFTPELFCGDNKTLGFSVFPFILLHVLKMHTKNELKYKSNQHKSRRKNTPYKSVLSSVTYVVEPNLNLIYFQVFKNVRFKSK